MFPTVAVQCGQKRFGKICICTVCVFILAFDVHMKTNLAEVIMNAQAVFIVFYFVHQ